MRFNFEKRANVFTDCSTITDGAGKTIVSCGYCVVVDNRVVEHNNIIMDESNNAHGELFAILMGVTAGLKYATRRRQVNVFSDSKTSIKALTEHVFQWHQRMEESGMSSYLNSQGDDIVYQELYVAIMETIISSNRCVNFYHIKSHTKINSKEDVHIARTMFNKLNDTAISDYDIKDIAYFNNYIDNISRKRLHAVVKDKNVFDRDKYKQFLYPVIRLPNSEELEKYKKLVLGNKIIEMKKRGA